MKTNGLFKSTVLFSIMISLPLILMILPCTAETMTSLEWICVQGNRFVSESGETVIFRGVNIRDPHELAGQGHWTRSHFAEAKHWGANVIRLPIHPYPEKRKAPWEPTWFA